MASQPKTTQTTTTVPEPSAASKFSSLPDIDPSAVDVYETASSPELKPLKHTARTRRGPGGYDFGSDDDDDEDDYDEGGETEAMEGDGVKTTTGVESSLSAAKRKAKAQQELDDARGSIERKGIGIDEAKNRFANSTEMIAAKNSRRRRDRKQRDRYLESDVYELEGSSSRATETPIARLRRLKMEAQELEEQLASETASSQQQDGGVEEGNRGKKSQPSTQDVLSHLRLLRGDLDQLQLREVAGAADSNRASDARALIAALEKGTQENAEADLTAAAATGESAAQSSSLATAGAAPHLSGIDERLAALETIIGASQSVLEETQALPRPLLPTLARIEHLVTLLTQPRHIDAISKRIKLLVSELDRVYEARRKLAATAPATESALGSTGSTAAAAAATGRDENASTTTAGPLDPISLSKLDDLFALCSRVQPLLPLAPALLTRLRSLSTLHASASDFASDLAALEASSGETRSKVQDMDEAVKGAERSLEENRKRVNGNLESVMARMEALEKRIEAL